ncbi:MAG: bifunctional phosphoglucose/phosphomannose isomerase [bacterium]
MLLDDLKYINQIDSSGALQIASHAAEQLRKKFEPLNLKKDVQNVVYAAMGGSALAARLSASWPKYKVPFEIVTDYHLPAYVGKNTLVIAASYSGNTEETVNAFHEAIAAGAELVVIAGGGKLQQLASEHNVPFILLPKAAQPRFAVLYCFKALIDILESVGFVNAKDMDAELFAAADHLEAAVKNWLVDVPTSKNPAKQLALELAGTSPVIYAGSTLWPAAYKWKISFNENAKNVAWCNSYPEFCHNEFIGWASHPVEKPYSIVDLRSSFDNDRVTKRFEIVDKLLSGKRPAAHVVNAKGDTLIEQLVWTVVFGDFVSLYVGILNGVDPTPVDLVEKLKAELVK